MTFLSAAGGWKRPRRELSLSSRVQVQGFETHRSGATLKIIICRLRVSGQVNEKRSGGERTHVWQRHASSSGLLRLFVPSFDLDFTAGAPCRRECERLPWLATLTLKLAASSREEISSGREVNVRARALSSSWKISAPISESACYACFILNAGCTKSARLVR